MYHHLTVHIRQSSSNVCKLSEETISSVTGAIYSRTESYKLKSVCIPMRLDEFVDISIIHPLRHHHEFPVLHHHSQQGQCVLMTKSFPAHDLLAEPLCGRHKSVNASSSTSWKSHPFDLHKVAFHKYLQNLGCDLDPFVFTLPYFGKSASISRSFRAIVAEWNFY